MQYLKVSLWKGGRFFNKMRNTTVHVMDQIAWELAGYIVTAGTNKLWEGYGSFQIP